MGMDVGAGGGKRGQASPSMNVTPLVDVVLVLLILFMVIMPMMDAKFWVHVPPESDDEETQASADTPPETLTILVQDDGEIRINAARIRDDEFSSRLRRMLAASGTRQVYFDAQNDVPFSRAMEVMDLARAGGAADIAVLTEALMTNSSLTESP